MAVERWDSPGCTFTSSFASLSKPPYVPPLKTRPVNLRNPVLDRSVLGLEQLKSELRAAEFRLQAAEQNNDPLQRLLVPVEQVRNELNIERRQRHAERALLVSQVGELEAAEAAARQRSEFWQARTLRLEEECAELPVKARRATELWEMRTLELEQKCASLAVLSDTAQAKLEQAQWLEQSSLATSLAYSIERSEARNAERSAESQVQSQLVEVQVLERDLAARRELSDLIRSELRQAREENWALRSSFEQLLKEHTTLRADHDAQQVVLCETASRVGVLLSRNETLEARVELTAQQRAAVVALLPACAPPPRPPTPSTRGALPSGSTPRDGGSVHSRRAAWEVALLTDGLSNPLDGGPLNPLRSPSSRHHYPRSMGGRSRVSLAGLHGDTSGPPISPGFPYVS